MVHFKTIIYTTLVWLIIIGGGFAYLRFFDASLVTTIFSTTTTDGEIIIDTSKTGDSDAIITTLRQNHEYLTTQLGIMMEQIDTIERSIHTNAIAASDTVTATNDTTDSDGDTNDTTSADDEENENSTPALQTVNLYYFNERLDEQLPTSQQLNPSSITPIQRTIPTQDSLNETLKLTIEMLIAGDLTDDEANDGFVTEFPKDDFVLESVNVLDYGDIELTFSEVPGFTSGGSARVILIRDAIIKTAMQFEGVENVTLLPEGIFQP